MPEVSDRKVLEKFLNMPVYSPKEVLEQFSELENAVYVPEVEDKDSFVYVPSKREDRVVLIAHADTVYYSGVEQEIIFEDGIYRSGMPYCGIGADDRAGCAILYLLKDFGHSLLILDGEEQGSKGAEAIKNRHKDLFDEISI